MSEEIRVQDVVYVIDDEREIRLSLAFQLRTLGYDVHPFVAAADFLDQSDALRPGCVLLDVRMPGMSGNEALALMRQRGIDWPVVIITGHAEVPVAVEVMKNGALDFLEKPFEDAELQDVLRRGFLELRARREHAAVAERTRERLSHLSARENDVLRLMLAGDANKAIAHQLSLSVRTVEMHRANVLAKLEVRNVAEAASLVGGTMP